MKEVQAIRKIRDIEKLMHNNIRVESDKLGVNCTYRHIIFHLIRCDGQTQLELSKKTLFSAPTISLTLQKMEQEGYIKRVQDTVDGRQMRVYLTEEGRKLDEAVRKIVKNFEEIALKDFSSKEVDLLLSLLTRIEVNLGRED